MVAIDIERRRRYYYVLWLGLDCVGILMCGVGCPPPIFGRKSELVAHHATRGGRREVRLSQGTMTGPPVGVKKLNFKYMCN